MFNVVDFTVKRKEDGKEFNMIIGNADLNGDIPRYYIGIKEEETKWKNLETIDGMDEFNKRYEVIAIR